MRTASAEVPRHAPAARRAALFALAALFAACGGGGGGGGEAAAPTPTPTVTPPTFTASGTASQANLVTMTGAAVTGTTNRLAVQIKCGAPTTSTDVSAFAFDIVLSDPSLVVVSTVTAGGALTGTTIATAVLGGSRVVVGITKLSGAGNQIVAGQESVLTIVFRTLKKGATTLTFAGSPSNPQNPTNNPTALDSVGNPIPAITFDTASATLTQS